MIVLSVTLCLCERELKSVDDGVLTSTHFDFGPSMSREQSFRRWRTDCGHDQRQVVGAESGIVLLSLAFIVETFALIIDNYSIVLLCRQHSRGVSGRTDFDGSRDIVSEANNIGLGGLI